MCTSIESMANFLTETNESFKLKEVIYGQQDNGNERLLTQFNDLILCDV